MVDKERFLELMGVDNYAVLAGMEVVKADPGYAEVKLPITQKVLNGHGNLHGGALFTLADYAGAVASNMHGRATMAVNGSISFMRAVQSGYVLARATTVKTGRRINFITVEIVDDQDRPIASFQGGAMAVERKDGNAS